MEFIIHDTKQDELMSILNLNNGALPAVSKLTVGDLNFFRESVAYFRSLIIHKTLTLGGFLIGLTPGVEYYSPNYQWFMKKYDNFVYIDRIVIAPEYQGLGYGTHFYEDLKLFSLGQASRLSCEVNLRPRNIPSLRFHEKYGFKQVGTQKTEDGKKEVSLLTYDL